MSEAAGQLRVLVVDDEREVADAYALRLRGFCDVETAYSGPEALSVLEQEPIDVVLLDRHMPEMSGDDVLRELDERGYYGRVVMVTAVDPDFDVLELPFDDYLCKPVEREDVRAAIDQQRRVLAYETLGEYFGVESKRAVIEAQTNDERRQNHDGYAELVDRSERLRERATRLLEDESVLERFDAVGRGQ
ncbi:response regulator [Halapricum desulfuricans]|uniref:Rec domain n=1 Tax=Halapricum desulfuricans TaxID=2841257 RepID=A0A897MS78_9EURY|nr:response regulator [Halapricum desulfuricans]QSG04990.1 Rec domain [Halapricum desulfuricans]